jgi:hypothetical protein
VVIRTIDSDWLEGGIARAVEEAARDFGEGRTLDSRGLAIGVAGFVSQFPAGLPRPNLYEAAAQIIPVLIVTLAIENQAHQLWARLRFGYKLQVFIEVSTRVGRSLRDALPARGRLRPLPLVTPDTV